MKTIFNFKTALMAILLVCLNGKIAAQKDLQDKSAGFTNAIGIRLGGTSGIDFKHKFSELNSMELILGTFPNAFGITGLYERNVLTTVSGLNLYFGLGGNISGGYARNVNYFDHETYYYRRDYSPRIGLDGIAGLEYRIPKIPLVLSLDVKPFTEFYPGYRTAFYLDPGLGIKFAF